MRAGILDHEWQERLTTALPGSAEAFGTFCQEYFQPKIYGFALKFLRNPDDADDIVQETFEKLLKYQQRIRKHTLASFEAFVIGIAKNACIDLVRKKKPVEPIGEDLAVGETTKQAMVQQEIIAIVREILGVRCSEEERAIFRLNVIEEQTFRQIARTMRMTPGTVYNRYEGVLEKLRTNGDLQTYWEEIKE